MVMSYYPGMTPEGIRALTRAQFYTMLYSISRVDRLLGRSVPSENGEQLPPRVLGVEDRSKIVRVNRGK